MKIAYAALIPLALGLVACQQERFSEPDAGPEVRVDRQRQRMARDYDRGPDMAMSAPTSPVAAEPLPPIDGEGGGGEDLAPAVASAAPPRPKPSAATQSVTGKWSISDARGSCSIALTQQNLLDLYRANTSGCSAGSLAKVNSWQRRGNEIMLLEPAGRTAVRLFPKGDGTYEGQATTSGTVVRMSR